jgi:tetratricopeptide (TPR) repeat protein
MSESPATNHRRNWLAGLAAVALLVAAAVSSVRWSPPGPVVPEIPLAGQEPELAQAIEEARSAVVRLPRSADRWGHLGCVLLSNEMFPEISLVCFEEAERLDPNNPRWPYFTVDKSRPEAAVATLERVIALAKDDADAPSAPRLMLGETLLSLGRLEPAREQFTTVLATEPNNARARFGLGLLAFAENDLPESRTQLEACLGSSQARKKAAVQLATVCQRLGDFDDAKKYAGLARAMPNDGDWADPYVIEYLQFALRKRERYRAVENLEAQRQFGKAADILSQMIASDPDDYMPHLVLGKILPQMGQLSKAEEHLLKARELAPDKIQVHYYLSLVFYNEGEQQWTAPSGDRKRAEELVDKAIASARQVLSLRPDFGFAHMVLGLSFKLLGRRDEAIAELREALHCNPEYADNYLFLGQALADAGQSDEARSCLEQARLLSPPDDTRAKTELEKLAKQDAASQQP